MVKRINENKEKQTFRITIDVEPLSYYNEFHKQSPDIIVNSIIGNTVSRAFENEGFRVLNYNIK